MIDRRIEGGKFGAQWTAEKRQLIALRGKGQAQLVQARQRQDKVARTVQAEDCNPLASPRRPPDAETQDREHGCIQRNKKQVSCVAQSGTQPQPRTARGETRAILHCWQDYTANDWRRPARSAE